MPEDGFVFTSADLDSRDDRSFEFDLGAGETDLRTMTKAISREASLAPLRDTPEVDDGGEFLMPGDEFWL